MSVIYLEPKEYHTPLKIPAGSEVVGNYYFNKELQEKIYPELYAPFEIVGKSENPTTFTYITFVGIDFGSLTSGPHSIKLDNCIFEECPTPGFTFNE